ncbi:MAG: bifunctional oligoribonuclease/PAP phosphatase NrnA [Bacilli bacterium]|nr:bifunctional oligoribonuclease/PAP phosphatase NrnA [Bacilli bacterium]
MVIHKKIYNKIKEYDKIIIARHIGPDPDALGSSNGLKEIIKETFPKKEVYTVGSMAAKFKFMGEIDKVDEDIFKDSLLIVCDTPNIKRIDGIEDLSVFKDIIKIDHHPEIDDFANIKWIDDSKSSVCQMIIELTYNTRLKMTKSAAEKLFRGLVSDTERFLYSYTSADTMRIVSRLIDDTKIDFTSLYEDLYRRPLSDIKLLGYMYQNITVTENGLGYLKLSDKVLKEFNADAGSGGNLVNNFNNIDEILVWVVFTEDIKQNLIRVNARSRGPIINKVLENHNGGGHIYSSGARITSEDEINEIIKELDEVAKEYKRK